MLLDTVPRSHMVRRSFFIFFKNQLETNCCYIGSRGVASECASWLSSPDFHKANTTDTFSIGFLCWFGNFWKILPNFATGTFHWLSLPDNLGMGRLYCIIIYIIHRTKSFEPNFSRYLKGRTSKTLWRCVRDHRTEKIIK